MALQSPHAEVLMHMVRRYFQLISTNIQQKSVSTIQNAEILRVESKIRNTL